MAKDLYLEAFEKIQKKQTSEPSWVSPLRKNAIHRFTTLGFPTPKNEEWKYTSVEPIAQSAFRFPFETSGNGVSQDSIKALSFLSQGNRFIFVNAQFRKGLSTISLLSGIQAGSLKETLHTRSKELEAFLAKQASFQSDSFTALNTAFFEDGAYLLIPKGKIVNEPIEFLFFSSSQGEKLITQPRNLIILKEGAEATVIENYASLEGETFTNAVTEIILAPGARLTHYHIQKQNEKAFQVSTTQVSAERNSHFSSNVFSFGARLSRNNLNISLQGEGSGCKLNGLYMVRDHQHVDHHTFIDHLKPNGASNQIYKGVLSDKARAVFNGKIFVRQDAQKTDAHQLNKNLLLSQEAIVDTKPQLEISADDVKCTHGAAVGQLRDEEIFYLKSRGLGDEKARKLLTYGFAAEILENVKLDSLRARLDELIWERLK